MPNPSFIRAFVALCLLPSAAQAADQPQWGEAWTRNMVSREEGIPATFDPETGANIRWTAKLGTEAHSTPVVADGRVYIGTNNQHPRDPKHEGDRGVLMCFDEATGKLLWQLVVPKREEDPYFDWPKSGISSPATVEGDRVYIVTNRGEVACLDANGLTDGNDGPFLDEARHMTPQSEPPLALESLDADILWLCDLTAEAGIWSHDGAHSSILIHGNLLYLNSGTGVDNSHVKIRRPDAPSLVVIDKRTGRFVAREREDIGPDIFHCTWSSPSLARIDGKEVIVFAAGNGIVYGFEPIDETKLGNDVATLKKVWEYDFDPTAPKTDVHRYNQNKGTGPSNFFGMPVVKGNRLFVAGGGDLWWGKNESWLHCIDISGTGDITESALLWKQPLGRHVMSTPAVHNGLVFMADTSRFIYCMDAETGDVHWKMEADGDFWASPYVA